MNTKRHTKNNAWKIFKKRREVSNKLRKKTERKKKLANWLMTYVGIIHSCTLGCLQSTEHSAYRTDDSHPSKWWNSHAKWPLKNTETFIHIRASGVTSEAETSSAYIVFASFVRDLSFNSGGRWVQLASPTRIASSVLWTPFDQATPLLLFWRVNRKSIMRKEFSRLLAGIWASVMVTSSHVGGWFIYYYYF